MPKITISGHVFEYRENPTDTPTYIFHASELTGPFHPICEHIIVVDAPDVDTTAAHVARIDEKICEVQANAANKITELRRARNQWLALPNAGDSYDQTN